VLYSHLHVSGPSLSLMFLSFDIHFDLCC
jgi:hypothetical protein